MLTKLDEFLTHLNSQPNADQGFSAKTFYDVGREYGMTFKEICQTFLGKDRAMARGKYPATVSDEIRELAKTIPAAKTPKAPREKKERVAKEPKEKKSKVAHLVKNEDKETPEMKKRRELIANIAQRHSAEDKAIESIVKGSKSKPVEEDHSSQHDNIIHEEFGKIFKGESETFEEELAVA